MALSIEGWTRNGIPYRTDLVNVDGVAVTLFPYLPEHDRSAVSRAKSQMRNERDVVCFYVDRREGPPLTKTADAGSGYPSEYYPEESDS